MQYLPRLLNEYRLFPRLAYLLSSKDASAKLKFKIERFAYRATCALENSEAIYNAERTSIMFVREYLEQLTFSSNKRFAISTEPLFKAYSQIPAALSTIIVMQNQLLPLITAIHDIKISTPKSLNIAFKKGIENYNLGESITELLVQYWNNGGKYIREVRNVNEHFDALVDQTYFDLETEPGQILIFLPDNPEEESPSKFSYEKEIDAHHTIISCLQELSKLIDDICKLKNVPGALFTNSLTMRQMGHLIEEQERTLGMMISIEKVENGTAFLDTIEFKQIVPAKKGDGNISVRKMKTDKEIN